MNGLYNALFGMNPDSEKLLGILGLTGGDFYRFRDCYLSEDGEIVVHTRGGGGNRDDWDDGWLYSNPNYLGNQDDDFDCTYCDIRFRVPAEAAAMIEGMEPSMSPAEKWQALFAALKA